MIYKRIGDYIRLVDKRNGDLKVTNLLGINITKNFMPSVANTSESDLSKYKVIQRGQFAYSAMQVGRDETIRLALYSQNEPAIISPAYMVIESKDINKLLPEYMMMWFQKPESDRFGWFISDSSVRASLEWERFCDIQIPIPSIDEQKKYVAIYKGLMANQKVYQESLDDLQLICDSYIENLINKEDSKALGDYIALCEERNTEMKITLVQGVSITKKFVKTKANMTDVSIHDYKIVRKGQFAFNPNTARMGEKICVALNNSADCLVSKIYPVFKIEDNQKLLNEYLLLWFTRSEFDEYARFHSWGSARETFNWEDMCNVKLPIPDIKVQEAIVTIYHTLEARKRINEQLKGLIKPLCPVLMKGVVENFEKEQINSN